MIYEFALDPTVISSWDKFRYFVEKFGYDQGRLIANLPEPRKWKELVFDSCANEQEVKLATIFADLFNLDGAEVDAKFAHFPRKYDPQLSWFMNAERQHAAKPFHAVISHQIGDTPEFLAADVVRDKSPFFFVPREKRIRRKTAEMVDCVKTLLHASEEVLFVDPHFNPSEKRYSEVLGGFILAAATFRPLIRLEYHLAYDANPRRDPTPIEFFKEQCEKNLSKLLPLGAKMNLFRWRQRDTGDDMHPRYILTELGGVRFDHGLDEDRSVQQTFSDVTLLERSLHSQLWEYFRVDESTRNGQGVDLPYDCVDEVTIKHRP